MALTRKLILLPLLLLAKYKELQWGHSSSENLTFPINFSNIYIFLRCNITNSSSNSSYRAIGCISRNNSGAQVLVPAAINSYDWIAAGS